MRDLGLNVAFLDLLIEKLPASEVERVLEDQCPPHTVAVMKREQDKIKLAYPPYCLIFSS